LPFFDGLLNPTHCKAQKNAAKLNALVTALNAERGKLGSVFDVKL
jgi:hypothetical protein